MSFCLFIGGVFALNILRYVFATETRVNQVKTNFDEWDLVHACHGVIVVWIIRRRKKCTDDYYLTGKRVAVTSSQLRLMKSRIISKHQLSCFAFVCLFVFFCANPNVMKLFDKVRFLSSIADPQQCRTTGCSKLNQVVLKFINGQTSFRNYNSCWIGDATGVTVMKTLL